MKESSQKSGFFARSLVLDIGIEFYAKFYIILMMRH